MAKMIHHKLREKTKNMSPEEKFKYLHEHHKKKESKIKANREKSKKEFFSQPAYDSKGNRVKHSKEDLAAAHKHMKEHGG